MSMCFGCSITATVAWYERPKSCLPSLSITLRHPGDELGLGCTAPPEKVQIQTVIPCISRPSEWHLSRKWKGSWCLVASAGTPASSAFGPDTTCPWALLPWASTRIGSTQSFTAPREASSHCTDRKGVSANLNVIQRQCQGRERPLAEV